MKIFRNKIGEMIRLKPSQQAGHYCFQGRLNIGRAFTTNQSFDARLRPLMHWTLKDRDDGQVIGAMHDLGPNSNGMQQYEIRFFRPKFRAIATEIHRENVANLFRIEAV